MSESPHQYLARKVRKDCSCFSEDDNCLQCQVADQLEADVAEIARLRETVSTTPHAAWLDLAPLAFLDGLDDEAIARVAAKTCLGKMNIAEVIEALRAEAGGQP